MGWTYSSSWYNKQSIVNHCIDWGEKFSTLKHTVRGNRLWVLLQYNGGEKAGSVFVALYLLSKDGNEWGYKDMDDTCGPCYYDCPLSYITKTIESGRELSQTTIVWHEKVKQHHASKAKKRSETIALKAGMTVKFQNVIYKLLKKYPGRKGWEVQSLEDNGVYRMMAKQVSSAEVVI